MIGVILIIIILLICVGGYYYLFKKITGTSPSYILYSKASQFLDNTQWRCYLGRQTVYSSGDTGYDFYSTSQLEESLDSIENVFLNDQSSWGQDPTHGEQNYKKFCEIKKKLITDTSDSTVTLACSNVACNTTVDKNDPRCNNYFIASPRIENVNVYNSKTVFIIDVVQFPFGNGSWPAFWLCGGPVALDDQTTIKYKLDWPNYGEIDILEQVNGQFINHTTVHTSNSCTSKRYQDGKLQVEDTKNGPWNDCNHGDGRDGCSVQMSGNKNNGQFICEWVPGKNISYWCKPSKTVDLTKTSIDTSILGDPDTQIDISTCTANMQNMHMILNTALCGDWAGAVYNGKGQCKDEIYTNFNNNPAEYSWIINGIAVYTDLL